ncbi:MAG: type II secretion system F family protein [Planctomycetes bacterium]|nr:type II secretion system F family protein [Planctomycetota bacterium]
MAMNKQLSLTEELDAVAETLSKRQKATTRQLAERLRQGDSFSEALRGSPGVIPQAAILSAIVSEQNGTLPAGMRDAAVRHTKSGPGNDSGLSSISLVYPFAVLLLALLILNGILYYIIPKYQKIFDGFDTELPEFTQRVLRIAEAMNAYSMLYLLMLGLPLAVMVWMVLAYCRGWGEHDIPLVGRWFRRLDVPAVLRNLAATVDADQPLDDALLLLSREHRRRAVRNALKLAYEKYRQGDDCWYALRDASLLNSREVAVLRSAQRVGNLPWVLRQLAETIERRLSHRWLTVLEVIQPLTVLGLGLIVAAIEIALFSPLVSLILDLS